MAEAHTELEALREASTLPLARQVAERLRDIANGYEMVGGQVDRRLGQALNALLDMRDKLEAIRNAR